MKKKTEMIVTTVVCLLIAGLVSAGCGVLIYFFMAAQG